MGATGSTDGSGYARRPPGSDAAIRWASLVERMELVIESGVVRVELSVEDA